MVKVDGGDASGPSQARWPCADRERHRLEQLLEDQNGALELVARATPLPLVLQHVTDGYVRRNPCARASILIARGRRLFHAAATGLSPSYLAAVDGLAIGPDMGSCGTAAHLRELVISEDLEADPRWASFIDLARREGLRACFSIPIQDVTGEVLGTFAIYHDHPLKPDPSELTELRALAHVVELAVTRDRADRITARRERVVRAGLLGFASWDASGTITDANDRFLEIIGATLEDLTEGRLSWPALAPPEWHESDALAGTEVGAPIRIAAHERQLLRKGGGPAPVLVMVAPSDQETVAVVIDISESRRVVARLEEARGRAEQATRAKDEFLAMLGHELRNPLSPILTALELLRLRGVRSRELDVIDRQTQHLQRLVDDLLDVSRLARGKVELKREPCELADVVGRGVELASPLLERRGNRLELAIPRGVVVDVDPARMGQVLSNLLTNAAKYSNEGSRIQVRAEAEGSLVTLRVIDEGIGLAPELGARIFDLFVQQHQAKDRADGGLGLGLTIVRSLVELHGGAVRAESPGEGLGSSFVIELPRAIRAARAALTTPAAPEAAPVHAAAARQILIVDDNDDAAEVLAEALRLRGYAVQTAPDGPSALLAAPALKPHIALLDIGLPVMDGYELARRLRSLVPGVTCVAITGYGQESDRRRSRQAGFAAHLVKPVQLDQLTTLLERITST